VFALSVPALKDLARASADALDPIFRARIDALAVTLPFAMWRLFLDRKVSPERPPFVERAHALLKHRSAVVRHRLNSGAEVSDAPNDPRSQALWRFRARHRGHRLVRATVR
jgi:hypothetical protein